MISPSITYYAFQFADELLKNVLILLSIKWMIRKWTYDELQVLVRLVTYIFAK